MRSTYTDHSLQLFVATPLFIKVRICFALFQNVVSFFMNPRDSLSGLYPEHRYSDIRDEDTTLTGTSERDSSSVQFFVLILKSRYFPIDVLSKILVPAFRQDFQSLKAHSFEPEIPIKSSIHLTVTQILMFPRFISPLTIVDQTPSSSSA